MSRRRVWVLLSIVSISLFIVVTLVRELSFYRQQMIVDRPMLDVAFEHSKHKKEQCATCHHNYIDDAVGSGGCYDCHKYTEQINQNIEAIFHKFCENCHINKALEELDSGPLRQCSGCHIDDQIVN
ncbi:MAG: cytochrome c3 family protein [Gammaproteobacteria bacterium]|nr:cytochrome c3 family protein [Gammaproteobacteria bacterium]